MFIMTKVVSGKLYYQLREKTPDRRQAVLKHLGKDVEAYIKAHPDDRDTREACLFPGSRDVL